MHQAKSKKSRLTLYIGIALVIGILTGFILNKQYVGTENSRIMNAEAQQKLLHDKMKVYESPKDTIAFGALNKLKEEVTAKKKAAERAILNNNTNTSGVDELLFYTDSLKNINSRIALLLDTSNAGYKALQKEKEFVDAQKTESLKARDKKLDWFSLLADIFIRLIKMIVAPLVFATPTTSVVNTSGATIIFINRIKISASRLNQSSFLSRAFKLSVFWASTNSFSF